MGVSTSIIRTITSEALITSCLSGLLTSSWRVGAMGTDILLLIGSLAIAVEDRCGGSNERTLEPEQGQESITATGVACF
jgi:hypothetical protein